MGVQKMWGVQQGPCFALDVPRALFESLSWAGAVALCFAIYVAGSSAPSQRTGLLSMSVFEGRSVHAACANMRKEGDGQRLSGLRDLSASQSLNSFAAVVWRMLVGPGPA